MTRHNVTLFLFGLAVSSGALSCKGTKTTPAGAGGASSASALGPDAVAPISAGACGAKSAQPTQGSAGFDSTKIVLKCDKTASIDAGAPGRIGAGCPKTWSDALSQATAWCADPAKSAGKPRLGLYENCEKYTIVVQAGADSTDVCYYEAKTERLLASRVTGKNGVTCRGEVPDVQILCPTRLECGQK
jgi:hypothetical protein